VLTAPSLSRPPHRRNVFIAGAILVLAALAAYHNSFSGPLVYDDIPAIKDNPTIRQLWPLSTVLSPPNDSGITVNGRPLVNLSLAINYAIGGTEVVGYHVFNLAIHIMAGLALFGIVRRSLQLPALRERFGPGDSSLPLAFTIALLWTLHPLQTESVTYIIQRAESLVGLFYLLTFYCFVRSLASPRSTRWQILTVLACLLGMASKEVMASAPLLILLYDRALVSGTFRDAWQRHRQLYLGLAATWVPLGWLVAGTGSRGGTAGFGAGGISSWDYALTSSLAIGKYLALTFWPAPLVFDYGTALQKDLLPVLPQSILIVVLVAATFYALWRRPIAGFLGMGFFAILGPSSSIIPIASEPMAEHRMYLPLAALISVLVLGSALLLGRRCVVFFLALALGAGWLTIQRNEVYRDELSLWRHTQLSYPTSERAHNNVGEIYFRQEKHDEAIACFREAVRLLPNYIDAINNLGNSLTQRGQAAEAMPRLELALRLKPGYAETHNNLGTALYQLGRPDEAIAHYREAILLKPAYADAHNNLGVVLAEQGKHLEAIEHYLTALKHKANYIDAHYNYGNALKATDRIPEAISQYSAALRLKPNHPEANNNLGSIYYQQGKIAEAKTCYEAAIREKADYPDAQNNLGVVLFQTGNPSGALTHFEAAVRQKPDYRSARENLSAVYDNLGAQAFQDGDLARAKQCFESALLASPTNATAQNNLGVILWRSGSLSAALPYLEEAVRLKPDYTDAVVGLASLRAQIAIAAGKP